MPPQAGGDVWHALFLRAPGSPGTIYGFLQRRWGNTAVGRARLDRLDLLLSDAAPPEGWRALVSGEREALAWMEEAGPILAVPFPPVVTLLWADAAVWGFSLWPSGGGPKERGGGPREPAAARRGGLLPRLLSLAGPPTPPEVEWAQGRGLPVDRVPARAGRRPPPRLDWATVAGLVERDLLVESGPRLYRLRFGGTEETPK